MANTFKPVPFVNLGAQYLDLKEELIGHFDRLSKAGSYILGEDVLQFEKDFARYSDSKFAVGVGNATDGIMLALKALDVGPGDEVITAPNSFIGTAGAIVAAGAKPVFADVGTDYNLDPIQVEKALTSKTKALMPVHLTGMPAKMDALNEIAKRKKLFLVEDCAQAVGATYNGRKVGSFGEVGVFSLHPLKNLHVHGDGGVLTTNNEDVYKKLTWLRTHGLINRDESVMWGYNSRLDAIQAAIASVKLKLIDGYNRRYREIAKMYRETLKGLVHVPEDSPGCLGVYHNFVIMTPKRSELQGYLLKHGQETKIHYPIPLHLQKAAANLGFKKGDFPVAEKQAQEILTLPIYPELTDEQVQSVAQLVKSFFKS